MPYTPIYDTKYHQIGITTGSDKVEIAIFQTINKQLKYSFDITEANNNRDEKLIRQRYEKLLELIREFEEKYNQTQSQIKIPEFALSLFK